MTDITSTPPRRQNHHKRGAEFYLYFSLIFLCAIPFAFVRWVRDVTRLRTLDLRGPLARAWAEADRVTPLIFSV